MTWPPYDDTWPPYDDTWQAFAMADYVSINMPYIKGVTHHAINAEVHTHALHLTSYLSHRTTYILHLTAGRELPRATELSHESGAELLFVWRGCDATCVRCSPR